MKTKPTKGDFLIISAALLTAVLLFVIPLLLPRGGTLAVRVGNETLRRCPLSRDCEFTVENNGVTLTVVIRDGAASVTESNCGNRVCVNTGSISRPGQSIVCAPAGVVLTVEGGEPDADAVAG